jgi:hypothetical protein
MMQVTFDTQTAVNLLRDAGFEEQQAQAIVTVIKNAHCELATKHDLVDLKKDLIIWLGMIIFVSFGLFASLVKLL